MFNVLKAASFSFFIPEYFTSRVGEFLVAIGGGIEVAIRGLSQSKDQIRQKLASHSFRKKRSHHLTIKRAFSLTGGVIPFDEFLQHIVRLSADHLAPICYKGRYGRDFTGSGVFPVMVYRLFESPIG